MDQTPFPQYAYPRLAILRVAASIFLHRRRSFREDGRQCLEMLKPPLRLLGERNLPNSGPCLITFNHYHRPGFNAWWMALAIAATVPAEVHFVMTGALTFPGKWYARLGEAGSRWLLRKLSYIYGYTTMPPMPPRPWEVEARACAIRKVLSYTRDHPQGILGLAPEGSDQPGGVLTLPPAGAGRFISLLARRGFTILPVGAFEQAGEFCLNLGPAYELEIPHRLKGEEKDRHVTHIVMSNISKQLPSHLRGEFQ